MIALFPNQTAWTDETCHYVVAIDGFRRALLAGPYRTHEEAEAVLDAATHWALHVSGDPDAGIYRYAVSSSFQGHSRSILGEIRTQALEGLTRFDGYEIAPCLRHEEPDSPGRFYNEACEAAEADVWSLYGRIPGQGVEAIGDFDTREHAEEVYARITGERYGR